MSSMWVFVFNLIILFSLYQSCPFIGDSEKNNYDLERSKENINYLELYIFSFLLLAFKQ